MTNTKISLRKLQTLILGLTLTLVGIMGVGSGVEAAKYNFRMVPLESRFPNPIYNGTGGADSIQFKPTGGVEDLVVFNNNTVGGMLILNYVLPADVAECKATIKSLNVKSAVEQTSGEPVFVAYASARSVGPNNAVVPFYYPLYPIKDNTDKEQQGATYSNLVFRGNGEDPLLNTNFDGTIYADVKIGEFTMGQDPNLVTIPSLSGDVSRFNFVVQLSEVDSQGASGSITVTTPMVEIDFDETTDISNCPFITAPTPTPTPTPVQNSNNPVISAAPASTIKAPKTGAIILSLILTPMLIALAIYLYIAHHNKANIKKRSER